MLVVRRETVISSADQCSALSLIEEMRLTRCNREGVITPTYNMSMRYLSAERHVSTVMMTRHKRHTKSSLPPDDEAHQRTKQVLVPLKFIFRRKLNSFK